MIRALACSLVGFSLGCSAASGAGGNGGAGGAATGGSGGSLSTGGSGGSASGGNGGSLSTGGTGGAGGSAGCTQNVDIVFSMDVSTSMGPFLTALANDLAEVDGAVQALNLASTPHYGLVVFVDDTTFARGGAPYPMIDVLKSDFQGWAASTSTNRQTSGSGSNGTWPENSLDSLYRGAKEFQWRPAADTLRIVIHTTDDTFWNGPTFTDGVQVQHGYADTVQALQEEQVRVFAFAATLGGPFETDDVSEGWFAPYAGQPALPPATGGGVFDVKAVLGGQISLADSITSAVSGSFCQPYPPPQ